MPLPFMLLVTLWIALLFGGLIFGKLDDGGEGRMPAWTRIGSSVVLVAAAWAWAAAQPPGLPLALIAIGMTAGLTGDIILARRQHHELRPVAFGMAAFGACHVFYCLAFLFLAANTGLGVERLLGPWLAWVGVGAAGWYVAVQRGRPRSGLRWAALAYALLLASTVGLATALALQTAAPALLAVGGALFLASDLVLAYRIFGGASFRHSQDIIWLMYGPGQALIVFGLHL
jgi:hypothetical protein